MDYRELLNMCKTKPGWLSNNEQRESESQLRYIAWKNDMDEEYRKKKRAEAKKSRPRNKS